MLERGRLELKKGAIFFSAMLYGTSWVVGLINLFAAIAATLEGSPFFGYLPMILMPFGIVILIHQVNGWFPFRRQS